MLAAHTSFPGAATAAIVSGLLMFALLPIAGLLAAMQHYVRRLDWRYVALTVGVLVLAGPTSSWGVHPESGRHQPRQ